MAEHVFVTVGNRRWCVCCDLFQRRRAVQWPYAKPCDNSAPAAEANRQARERLPPQGDST